MDLDLERPSTNEELERWARRVGVKLDGVVKRDGIPRKFRPGASYIVNLSDLTADNGTHWCAIYKLPRRQGSDDVVVFDSFGMKVPEAPDITLEKGV